MFSFEWIFFYQWIDNGGKIQEKLGQSGAKWHSWVKANCSTFFFFYVVGRSWKKQNNPMYQ